MHDRNILKFKAIKSNDRELMTACDVEKKKQGNLVNSEIRLAKQNYCLNNLNKCTGDSSNTWEIISELAWLKYGKKSLTSLKLNDVSIASPTMLSNEFNDHFGTIGPKLSEKLNSSHTDSFLDYLTSIDERFQLRPSTTNKNLSPLN